METEKLLDLLLTPLKDSPLKIKYIESVQKLISEKNFTDVMKTILLSDYFLKSFQTNLKIWNPERPHKTVIENLKLILLLANEIPDLNYNLLSESGYLNEVMKIFYSCLRYLAERNQKEIDENCTLSVALSVLSKYALKFCIKDTVSNSPSWVGRLFFKEALNFLIDRSTEFTRNPNNFVYVLILMNTLNSIMSQFSGYKSLFVEFNGIKYCLHCLSMSYKDKRTFFQNLYYDLRILSILETFIKEPCFTGDKNAVIARLAKYLKCNGDLISNTTFIKESSLVLQSICCILMKMAMVIEGSREEICKHHVNQLLWQFLNKDKSFAKTIYTTILVLEAIDEDDIAMEIDDVVGKCERLSKILFLAEIYDISPSSDHY